MKKKYTIPQSQDYNFFFEGNILSESSVNKYNTVKIEEEEQYSNRLTKPHSPWDNME